MASSTFFKLATGAQFTLPGYPAKEDGTSVVYTKLDAVRARDEFGRVWSFSPSLAIGAQGFSGASSPVPATSGTATTTGAATGSGTGKQGPAGPAGPSGPAGANGLNSDLTRTSSTSQTIGAGSLTFVFDTPSLNLGWIVGTLLEVAAQSDATKWMQGQVTAVSSTQVTINVTTTNGSGTFSPWNIFLAGIPGPTGPTGATGPAGPGVPTGGTAGQILSKIDATNYNTQWITPAPSTDVLQVQVFS